MTNIPIDETLDKWRGRVSFRQYITSKAAKYGITAFVLAEAATGYIYCHYIYTGNEKEAVYKLSSDIFIYDRKPMPNII